MLSLFSLSKQDYPFLEIGLTAGLDMPYGDVPAAGLVTGIGRVQVYNSFFFCPRALRNHSPSAPTSPSSGKPLPFFDFRRGMGMDLGSQLAESWWGGTGI